MVASKGLRGLLLTPRAHLLDLSCVHSRESKDVDVIGREEEVELRPAARGTGIRAARPTRWFSFALPVQALDCSSTHTNHWASSPGAEVWVARPIRRSPLQRPGEASAPTPTMAAAAAGAAPGFHQQQPSAAGSQNAEAQHLMEFAVKAAESFVSAYYAAADGAGRNQVRGGKALESSIFET